MAYRLGYTTDYMFMFIVMELPSRADATEWRTLYIEFTLISRPLSVSAFSWNAINFPMLSMVSYWGASGVVTLNTYLFFVQNLFIWTRQLQNMIKLDI